MKRFIFIFSMILVVFASSLASLAADNFPDLSRTSQQQAGVPHSAVQERFFYGYVPPPPIRHTWPGGYKVLFHEVMNTLMDHVIGRY
jgi:hypothetical protein